MEPIRKSYEDTLRECGLILSGHFVYKSGKHGGTYVAKDALFLRPLQLQRICGGLADLIYDAHILPDEGPLMFIGPATAGVALAPIAALSYLEIIPGRVMCGWADKKDNKFVIGRSFADAVRGQRVIITEDILTTGGSVDKVEDAIAEVGGIPTLVVCMWNRGSIRNTQRGTPIHALVETQFPSYNEVDCPLCKERVPMRIDFGHGALWIKKNPRYLASPLPT